MWNKDFSRRLWTQWTQTHSQFWASLHWVARSSNVSSFSRLGRRTHGEVWRCLKDQQVMEEYPRYACGAANTNIRVHFTQSNTVKKRTSADVAVRTLEHSKSFHDLVMLLVIVTAVCSEYKGFYCHRLWNTVWWTCLMQTVLFLLVFSEGNHHGLSCEVSVCHLESFPFVSDAPKAQNALETQDQATTLH